MLRFGYPQTLRSNILAIFSSGRVNRSRIVTSRIEQYACHSPSRAAKMTSDVMGQPLHVRVRWSAECLVE